MATAKVGENDIYYEIHGAGPGDPAVLIMGLGTDLHAWERQLPALTTERRVMLLDNRGAGRSAKPNGPYTTAGLADDVAGVMDAAGFARAHVIGISLGGAIAQELVLRHGRRTRSLTLIATFAEGRRMQPTASQGMGATARGTGVDLGAMLAAAAAGNLDIDPRAVFGFLIPLVFSAEFIAKEREYLRGIYERQMSYGWSPAGLAGQVAAAVAHDTVKRLATIGAPTLVVHGTGDRLVPAALSLALSDGIPGARRVEIAGGVHGLNLELADQLNPLLADWLREHDSDSR